MKKFFLSVMILCGLIAFASASNLDDAINWMYDNGLTIHNNATDFNADRGLRRDEAAKFFVQFSKLLGKDTYVKTTTQCTFSDINQSRSDLKDIVVESCKLGLFQGNKGKFTPQNQLTNAQAITVLVRLLAGMQSEIGLTHRADNYYAKANELGVLYNVDMSSQNSVATRGNVGVVIYNGRNLPIAESNISPNKIILNQGFEAINVICKRYDDRGIPNTTRGADAKFINAKLQDVRDNGQQLVSTYVSEANAKLNEVGLTNSNRCRYSWLIDALQKQQGYMRSHTTANGITTIGIDFLSYQDDISKIANDGEPGLDVMKNTSTKVRYYQLSSSPQLQTLSRDARGYVTNNEEKKYLNDFNNRLNDFCNNESIYNGERDSDWKGNDLGLIDRNNFRGLHNIYCVKDILNRYISQPESAQIFLFDFNAVGQLQKIDLNRRYLSLAG